MNVEVTDEGRIELENCEYKTHPAGFGGKKNCNFNIRKIPDKIQKVLRWCTKTQSVFVIIPKGAKMYRGTLVSPNIEKLVPWVVDKNFGWFTSTIEHQGNVNYTQIDEYETREALLCMFEPNLHYSGMRGNSYYNYPVTAGQNARTKCNLFHVNEASELLNGRDLSLTIDGYVGCDECEIGLTKESIIAKLKHRGIVKTKSLAYID